MLLDGADHEHDGGVLLVEPAHLLGGQVGEIALGGERQVHAGGGERGRRHHDTGQTAGRSTPVRV